MEVCLAIADEELQEEEEDLSKMGGGYNVHPQAMGKAR